MFFVIHGMAAEYHMLKDCSQELPCLDYQETQPYI